MMNGYWQSLPPGILTDTDIATLAGTGKLITAGFNPDSLEQCCYEFHIGDTAIDLSKPEADRIVPVTQTRPVIIPPRSTLVVKLAEAVSLPHDCLARFLLKGKFFSVGLVPVNTYADPGFDGNMGIVLTNASNNYLRLPKGEAIAKATFEKLHASVNKSYRGQHGFGTGHWPVLQQFILNDNELEREGIAPKSLSQIERVYGREVADLSRRLRFYSVGVWIQLTVVVGFLLLALLLTEQIGAMWAIVLGVGSNLLTNVVIAISRRFLPASLQAEL